MRAARTGVQQYEGGAEYRDSADVFAPESLASWVGAPLTVGHKTWVMPRNANEYAVGYVESVSREDAGDVSYVLAVLVLTSDEVITDLRRGALAEFSAGYSVDLLGEPGVTPSGERFNSVQKSIRVNHLAIGPAGWARCGSACSVV